MKEKKEKHQLGVTTYFLSCLRYGQILYSQTESTRNRKQSIEKLKIQFHLETVILCQPTGVPNNNIRVSK